MKIRKFKRSDTQSVANLIVNTYKKFNSSEFFEEDAISDYINIFDISNNSEEKLFEIFSESPIFFVAENQSNIIGMIRGRKDKISNLFVSGSQHKKGIGKKLVELFELESKKQGSSQINIRSTIYAVPFYQKMGYQKISGLENFKGLKVYLMSKKMV